jgi:hypothetical protein
MDISVYWFVQIGCFIDSSDPNIFGAGQCISDIFCNIINL